MKNNKITISGKCTIVDTNNEKKVIKKKNKDIPSLYNYFNSRNFSNYVNLIDYDDDTYIYEYLDNVDMPINQKCVDMAKVISNLHYKTSYFDKLVIDEVKEIYEKLNNNILYMENYYNEIFDNALKEEYIRPSYYLLLINSTKINALINFLKKELETWYKLMIDKDKTRVVYVHNNLSIDHFIKDKIISWDNYTIDSPTLDLINLYQNDYNKYDFILFFDEYFKNFELLEEEKHLLYLCISMPPLTYFTSSELENTIIVSKFLDYIVNTEKVVSKYYNK